MTPTDLLLSLAETSFAVGLLVLLVLVIRKPFASMFGARAAYALWLAPLARLFVPELAVLPAPEATTAPAAVELIAAPIIQGATASPSTDFWSVAAAGGLFLWITVAIAWIAMRLDAQRRFAETARAQSSPARDNIIAELRDIAGALGLKRLPEVRIAGDARGPFVIGLFRSLIILPANFETEYNASEQRLALAHEVAHIVRGDIAASWIATFLQAAQWPNPLIHFAARAFRIDQEAACDAYVLARCGRTADGAASYANAILKSAASAAQPALGHTLGHPLKERLMLLKNAQKNVMRQLLGGAGALALIAAGLAATADYAYADDDKKVEIDNNKVKERRVLVFSGSEDEVVFNDVSVGGRTQVFEFNDDDGERRVIRIEDGKKIVRVFDKDGNLVTEEVSDVGDGENVFAFRTSDDGTVDIRSEEIIVRNRAIDGERDLLFANCTSADGEGEPVLLEWRDEKGEKNNKRISHTVFCLTGEDASPENRAAALEKAIESLEKRAKEDERRNKEMIKSLREQLKDVESKKVE
ncbi:MAG: M56 family metallopeptidase [Pseudomonadota bacterium]